MAWSPKGHSQVQSRISPALSPAFTNPRETRLRGLVYDSPLIGSNPLLRLVSIRQRMHLRHELQAAQEVLESPVGAQGSFQPWVFRLGFLQDGDVRVGVFPKGKEVLVGHAGLGFVALERVGARQAEFCQRHQR